MHSLPRASRHIPESCRSEFTQHVGVGLEPLVSCLVSNRQFIYLLTAVTAGATTLLSTHADGQGVDISFTGFLFVCLFVCLFVRFGFHRRG